MYQQLIDSVWDGNSADKVEVVAALQVAGVKVENGP